MKALSFKQPWAWAVLNGKLVENRNWKTEFRGEFLIHASKTFDKEGYAWLSQHQYLLEADLPSLKSLPIGGIVGKAYLVDCVNKYPSPFFFGPYGFVLKYACAVEFIPCKGKLGFFDVEVNI